MTIQFNLDFEDLTAFQLDVIKHSHTHHLKETYFKWITAIVLLLAALFLIEASIITIITSFIITIIYVVAFPFFYTRIAFFKLTKQMQKNDYSHVLGVCEMTLSDTGIVRELKGETTHFDWIHFEKWSEDSHHYFLYVSDLQGLIIPKEPDGMNEMDKTAYNDFIKRQIDVMKIKQTDIK